MSPHYSKVSELPFVFGELTKEKLAEIRRLNPGQPKNMDYRIQFIKGYGASTKDLTWDRIKHIHECCGSPVAWRHRAKCPKILRDQGPDDLSDLKDI